LIRCKPSSTIGFFEVTNMHFKSIAPPRRITALALACLLMAAQAQAQLPALGSAQRPKAEPGVHKAQASDKAKARARAKAKSDAKAHALATASTSASGAASRRAAAATATALLVATAASTANEASSKKPADAASEPRLAPLPTTPTPPSAGIVPMPSVVEQRSASGQGADYKTTLTSDVQSVSAHVLNLAYLLNQAAMVHPSIQAARLDARASSEDLKAVERQRWPTLSAIVENTSTNPNVTSTRSLRMEQNLWDGGRVSARIREAEASISVNEARIYIQNQTLSMQIVNAWQNLLSADGRIQVARDTLEQLGKYRQQMMRRVTADVSPPIDLELVQSRILQTEVELTQALNSRQVALGKLEQYSGVEGLSRLQQRAAAAPGLTQTELAANQLLGLNWFDVASQHPDVHKARQDAQVAQQRIDGKRAEQWPQVYFRLDQPVSSANNELTGFVGLRYTPGAGLSTGIEAQALASRAASLEQSVDAAMRNVLEALYADRDELSTSRTRMLALDKSVQGSRAVLESYGRQFTAGRKTWQDLMNAVRELAQNQYNLVDTHAAMVSAMYRLQIRTGQSPSPVE
jgi:adhesin transport system outer membrane protein